MEIIRTVNGDIPPSKLGLTLPHEHLLTLPPEHVSDPDLKMTSAEIAASELMHFRRAGGQAIVEMSTADYGRNAVGLRDLARKTSLNIICATGFIKEAFFAKLVSGKTEVGLYDRMVADLEQG
ncbi:MAG: hypothetical protein WA957_03555, partial [Alteraurantiacibacter sp.]